MRTAVLALIVSALWGGNVVAIKYGLATVPPIWSAFWRMVIGSVTVAVWAWAEGASLRPRRDELGLLSALVGLFAVQISLLNTAVGLTSAAYAVVLLNTHPIFTNLFGHFLAGEERLTARRLVGLALSFGGMYWVVFGRPDAQFAAQPLLGNALTIVSAILLPMRVLITRRLVQKSPATKLMFWQMAGALPVFAALGFVFEPFLLQELSWDAIAALLYQGSVVAGFCFVMWTAMLREHSASTLSIFAFTVPFFGVFLSALIFGEPVTPRLLSGAGLVTLGIFVVTRAPSVEAQGAPESDTPKEVEEPAR